MRYRVPPLKQLCVEVVVANPQLPCASLPEDLRDAIARRLFFGRCLLGGEAAVGPGVAALLQPLWLRSPAAEDSEWDARLAFARGFAERFLGASRVRVGQAMLVRSVAAATGRAWENERPEAVVEVEERGKLRVECRLVGAGHWNAVALHGQSLLQELGEWLEKTDVQFCLVVSDLSILAPCQRGNAAVVTVAELQRPPPEVAEKLSCLLGRLVLPGEKCEQPHCPFSLRFVGCVPCRPHLAALQRQCHWEGSAWLRQMREACPWDAELFERLEQEADAHLEGFLRAQRTE